MMQLLQMQGVKQGDGRRGKIRAWQRGMIPLHLHARQLTFPKFDNGKDVTVTAPLPIHFEETLQNLQLHPKRNNMAQSREESMYFRLRRLGKSTKSIVGFWWKIYEYQTSNLHYVQKYPSLKGGKRGFETRHLHGHRLEIGNLFSPGHGF